MGTGAMRGITDDEVKEALRDGLVGSFGPLYQAKYQIIPLDELFYSYLRHKDAAGEITLVGTQVLDTYWHHAESETNYIAPPAPVEDYQLCLYTRSSWKYPWGGVYAMLPSLPISGCFWPFGVEPGSGAEWGLICYRMTGDKIYAYCDGVESDITSYLPSDYATANHLYTIKVNRSTAEFYIDHSLVAAAVRGGISISAVSGPPYNIFGTTRRGFDEAPAFIEFFYCDVEKYYLNPRSFRVMDGDPLPPRHYDLYSAGTNTKWVGNSFNTAITSHPIPVFGYPKKVFLFQSNAAGTVAIEVYAGGGWREVVSETVTANSLWDYVLNLEVPIARMKYTPTNSDSIAVAECNLS